MIRILFLMSILALLLTSCATIGSMMSADHNMRYVEINMTKEQVISIMGDKYEMVGSTEDLLILGYKTADDGIYKLYFENGLLKEWYKEWLPAARQRDRDCGQVHSSVPIQKDNTALKMHLDAHRNAMLSTASTDSDKQHINLHMDAHEKAMLGQ